MKNINIDNYTLLIVPVQIVLIVDVKTIPLINLMHYLLHSNGDAFEFR